MIIWDEIQQQLNGSTAIPIDIAQGKGWNVEQEQIRHTTYSAYASAAGAYSWAGLDVWDTQDAIQDACLLVLRYGVQGLEQSTSPDDLQRRWHVGFRDRCKAAIRRIIRQRLPIVAPDTDIDPLALVPWSGHSQLESEALEAKAEKCLWQSLDRMDADMVQLVLMLRGGKTAADFLKWRANEGRPCTKQAVSIRLSRARELIQETWENL